MKDKTPKKMGRPKSITTEEQKRTFETLMGIPFVTTEIIANFFQVGESTIVRWIKQEYGITFDDLRRQKMNGLKLRLAGKQFEMAMKGNTSMAIWLGKQWLGQSDKVETQGTMVVENKVTDQELENLKKMLKEDV